MRPTIDDIELADRALEAMMSLARSLGTTTDVRELARRALFTVSGQILVRKSAIYLYHGSSNEFRLCESLGIRPKRLAQPRFDDSPQLRAFLEGRDGLVEIDEASPVPEALLEHFRYVASITDGTSIVGLLVLGERLSDRSSGDHDRQLIETLGVMLGTTIRRSIAYEKLAESKAELELAQRLRKQIIDHVSHEFNTPLMVLKSTLDFMKQDADEDMASYLSMQDESIDRLEHLVRSILQLGSPESQIHNQVLSYPRFVRNVVAPAVSLARGDQGTLHEVHLEDPDLLIPADAQAVSQIVAALVHNACAFSGEQSPCILVLSYPASRVWWEAHDHLARLRKMRNVDPDELARNPQAKWMEPQPDMFASEAADLNLFVEVIDFGIGIPPGEQDLIFEPFAQGSNSPQQGVSGAGVGLSAARTLARAMGGDVLVRSDSAVGTVFALVLPALCVDLASRRPSKPVEPVSE